MASALHSSYSPAGGLVGVIVWVYDETGLAFCARYDCSQCMPEPKEWFGLEQELSMSLR